MKSVLRQDGIQQAFFSYRQALIAETKAEVRMHRLLEDDAIEAELIAQEQAGAKASAATNAAFATLDRALLSRLSQGSDEASA